MVVEDSESLASSLALAIETIPDVKALVAHHPEAALGLLTTYPDISALLTDLNLPAFDGFELIDRVRQLETYKDLPAIMITAEESIKLADNGERSRPNAILQKPFSPREVRRVLESLLA